MCWLSTLLSCTFIQTLLALLATEQTSHSLPCRDSIVASRQRQPPSCWEKLTCPGFALPARCPSWSLCRCWSTVSWAWAAGPAALFLAPVSHCKQKFRPRQCRLWEIGGGDRSCNPLHLVFTSPVIQDVMQEGGNGAALGGGLFVQETPGSVLAHYKLLKRIKERLINPSEVQQAIEHILPFVISPATFCQTSGFHC